MVVVFFFSFAVAYWLAGFIGHVAAFFVVGIVHLCIFILFVIFRKPWIERPLVRFLTTLLLG